MIIEKTINGENKAICQSLLIFQKINFYYLQGCKPYKAENLLI